MLLPMAALKSDILTITEVAQYLKVAERTLYRLAAAKKIPAFKVGGTWRFPRGDIDQWIKRQTAQTLCDNGSSAPGGKA
jgi:excisionase family DNA binding protein